MAASVLLNFANGINFTSTDPLIGLVRTGPRLLSYDQFSVTTFSKNDSERKKQIWRKIAELRNMLEDRSLSTEDQGERIRLIILLDFTPWSFLKPVHASADFDAAFPTLKLDYVKAQVEESFGKKHPLLSRFDYIYIFLDDDSDQARFKHYRLSAYHGYCRIGVDDNWLSKEDLQLNRYRDEALGKLDNPDAALPITDTKVRSAYDEVQNKLHETETVIKKYLSMIDKDRAFDNGLRNLFDVKTVSDFEKINYNHLLQSLIREIAGFGSSRFRDSTCIFTTLRQSIASLQCKDSIAMKSLIQLLCTMDDEQFMTQFRPKDGNDFHKLFIMNGPKDNHLRTDTLLQYYQDITLLGKQLGGEKWDEEKGELKGMNRSSEDTVSYYIYSPCEVNTEGAHRAQNKAVGTEGNKKEKMFREKRRVPFFFGATATDWKWYREVLASLNTCLSFEDDHDRAKTEEQKRATDSDFTKSLQKDVTYGELRDRIEKYPDIEIKSDIDYATYIENRDSDIEELKKKSEHLKRVLVRLGIRSRFLWIAVLSCLVFLLCFSFHFIYTKDDTYGMIVPIGFGAFVVILLIAMFIAQWIVAKRIRVVYREIDDLFSHLRKLADDHIESVNKLTMLMNQADADRKTLAEMKELYARWKKYNKKVEIWVNYTRSLKLLLEDTLKYLGEKGIESEGNLNIDSSILNGKPSVVSQIWTKDIYKDMKPKVFISNQNKENTIKNATSFISMFEFEIVQK